jgi:hypothetical protein
MAERHAWFLPPGRFRLQNRPQAILRGLKSKVHPEVRPTKVQSVDRQGA